jgi:hypothetical protein
MEASQASAEIVPLDLETPIWARVFHVAPLVLVGTLQNDGTPDIAPKHMAMPLGWENRYCFVCSPSVPQLSRARRLLRTPLCDARAAPLSRTPSQERYQLCALARVVP